MRLLPADPKDIDLNDFVASLGLQSWKPFLTLLALPPVPFLLLILAGAGLIRPRRGLGLGVVVVGVCGLWLSTCNGSAVLVSRLVLKPPPALTETRLAALRAETTRDVRAPKTAIVILGGGRELLAPEYGLPNLTAPSLERLRYGVWLARRTGAPAGFAGGIGWSQPDDVSEAEVAARIASQEFGLPLRWIDKQSRDTRENAVFMLAQLRPSGIERVLLVTHGWHMPRAMREFARAAREGGTTLEIEPAPMGLSVRSDGPAFDWLPSSEGYVKNRAVLREALAKLLRA